MLRKYLIEAKKVLKSVEIIQNITNENITGPRSYNSRVAIKVKIFFFKLITDIKPYKKNQIIYLFVLQKIQSIEHKSYLTWINSRWDRHIFV